MKNFHKKIPNKIFQEDNVEEFRTHLQNIKFTKYFYKIALFFGAHQILYEIVTEHNHIEDYYQLYEKIGKEAFKKFYDYYYYLEDKIEDYYFFKKVTNRMIRRGKVDEFIELFDNDFICWASYNLYYYIKIMVLQNNSRGIKFLYTYLLRNHDEEHLLYLVKLCLDFKFNNLILELYQHKILECRIELYKENITCASPLDYIIYQQNHILYEKLISQFKFNVGTVSFFHLLTTTHFYQYIDNISQNISLNNYHSMYGNESLIYNILKHSDFEYRLEYAKYVFEKLPDYYQKGVKETCNTHNKYNYNYNYFYDFYACICIFITDIEVHRYYINYLSLETSDFKCEDYIPIILINQNLKFIQQYVREFDITIKPNNSFYNIWVLLEECLDSYKISKIFSVSAFIDKIEYLVKKWGFLWYDFYHKNILKMVVNFSNFIDNSELSFPENSEEVKQIIYDFLERNNLISKFYSDKSKLDRKLDLLCQLNIYNRGCDCKNGKKRLNLKYDVCKCQVESVAVIKHEKLELHFGEKLAELMRIALQDLDIYNYLIQTKLIDINNIEYNKYITIKLLEQEPDFFREFISQLKPEIYQEQFLKIKLTEIYFYDICITNLKKIIEDGLDLSNEEEYKINVFGDFDEEDYYQAKLIFDMLIEAGLQNIEKELIQMIKNSSISDKILECYIQYMTVENCIDSIMNYNRYYLLNLFIQDGYRIKYKDIKKYELDIKEINFNKIEVSVSQTDFVCVICMTNTPSVVFLPCGHYICCQECIQMLEGECPFDKQDIEKQICYPSREEEEVKKCDRCMKTYFEYIFDTCGHRLCGKCSFKTKCSKCLKPGKRHKVFWGYT